MNKTFVTVVALSVDTDVAVLYLADGNTMTIRQGDPRLPGIVAACKGPLAVKKPVTVDVTEIAPERTEYSNAEKGTNGLIKFFRVAKNFMKELINTDSPTQSDAYKNHVSPLEIGLFPGQEPVTKVDAPVSTKQVDVPKTDKEINDEKMQYASERLAQIAAVGKGTDTPEFHKDIDEKEESIIAVNTETGNVIPDAQKLAPQLRAASKLSDFKGFTNLVHRLEMIINDRGHSIEDLMKFIEKGDLPIADDGCLVVYKRLKLKGDVYVDCHTGKVPQIVGSYVFMQPGLVDPNRRQDCSNGLHVASLSYLRSFSGDVTVVAKVRPEDVFAVPEYNHNKMRVCGYHILAELPENLRELVNGGGSISSDPEGAILLNKILRGNHVSVTQTVEIGGDHGSKVKVTDVAVSTPDQLSNTPVQVVNTTLELNQPLNPVVEDSAPVDAKTLSAPKPTQENKMGKVTIAQTIKGMSDRFVVTSSKTEREELATALLLIKKRSKKSWSALGLKDVGALVEEVLAAKPVEPTKPEVITDFAKPAEKPANKVATLSRADRVKLLHLNWLNAVGQENTKKAAKALVDFKRIAKVSWEKLGITNSDAEAIIKDAK